MAVLMECSLTFGVISRARHALPFNCCKRLPRTGKQRKGSSGDRPGSGRADPAKARPIVEVDYRKPTLIQDGIAAPNFQSKRGGGFARRLGKLADRCFRDHASGRQGGKV